MGYRAQIRPGGHATRPTRLLVLDFDGTLTDAEAEGRSFRDGYLADIAALIGAPLEATLARAAEVEAEIAARPGEHGWIFEGRIVAPATVDPYLRMMPVARRLLDQAGRLLDETDRTRVLDAILYKYNYQKTVDVARPHAAETLFALRDQPVFVVTNSHTDAVQRKIRSFARDAGLGEGLEWLAQRVHGRARKYQVDQSFDQVPEALTLPGLERPVLLRRRAYFEVLDQLRAQVGALWEEVAVSGDIFELDLALPLALGARVGLMANAFTPPWERAWLATHPRAALLGGVDALPAFAGF